MLSAPFPCQLGPGLCGQGACRPVQVQRSAPLPHTLTLYGGRSFPPGHSCRGWRALGAGPGSPSPSGESGECQSWKGPVRSFGLNFSFGKRENYGPRQKRLVLPNWLVAELGIELSFSKLFIQYSRQYSGGPRGPVRTAPWVCVAKLTVSFGAFRHSTGVSLPSRISRLCQQFYT